MASDKKAIRGAGGGGGSQQQRTPVEAPDSLHSTAYARILDMVSEGEIVGFADQANPLSCVFLNETPVANTDGTLNFKNVHITSRVGTQTQDPISGFDGVENETGVNAELKFGVPWTSNAITNLNVTAVRLRLSTPALTRTNLTNGDTGGTYVGYKIELSTDNGSFQEILVSGFSGKTTSKYERTHWIDLPPANINWILRVTRTTDNSTSTAVQDKTYIESIATIIEVKLRMPMTAMVAMVIDAEQFSSIPARSYRLKGRIIKVPTNYDPDTGVYTGIWDGTFQNRYSTNPAWIFYDMVTNDRYGLGHLVSPDLIDKWNLYKIGRYCDELVPDGRGGMERRFTSNLYLQTQNDAHRVLQDMATMFRGIMYAAGGSIIASSDMPEDVVYTYNPSNVVDGTFIYSGSSRRVRHTVALVSWTDMSDFGRAKVEYVEDLDGIARYGVQQTEVIAIGCTSRGQAQRMGRYILTTERYETDTVTFSVGLDGTFPAPGKIIAVSDPMRAGRRTGGRIRSCSGKNIIVDKIPIGISVGDTITAILPTGTPETRDIVSITGDEIMVDTDFTAEPIPGSVWMTESTELAAQRFRVISVSENTDTMTYSIGAVQHVEGKFDFVELGVAIDEPPITTGDGKVVFAPEDLVVTASTRSDNYTVVNVVNADWTPVVGAVKYGIQWRRNADEWSPPITTASTNFDFAGAFEGTYLFRVWAINASGYRSSFTFAPAIYVPAPEAAVKTLEIVGGKVEIDCAYAQFYLLLSENVTDVDFINVSPTDTIIITVEQGAPGAHTFNLGPSVTPVSGIPYVASSTAGAKDVLGLNTVNTGLTWELVYQKPENGDASFVASITPSTAFNSTGSPGAPSVTVTGSAAGGVAPITYAWTRADASGGANFLIDNANIPAPTFSIAYGTGAYNAMQTWRLTVTDNDGLVSTALVDVTLQRAVSSGMTLTLTSDPSYGSCEMALNPDYP